MTIGGSVSYFSDPECSSDDGDIINLDGICQPHSEYVYGQKTDFFGSVWAAAGKVWAVGAPTQEQCIDAIEEQLENNPGLTEDQCVPIPSFEKKCVFRQESFQGSFKDVQRACKTKYPSGSGLAVIENEEQNMAAFKACTHPRGCYLGLYQGNNRGKDFKGDDWRWVDGTPFKYVNWREGAPDDYKQDENWGGFYKPTASSAKDHAGWEDICSMNGDCTSGFASLCEDCSASTESPSNLYVKIDSNQPCPSDTNAKEEAKPDAPAGEESDMFIPKLNFNSGTNGNETAGALKSLRTRTVVHFGGSIEIFGEKGCKGVSTGPITANGFCTERVFIPGWNGSAVIGCLDSGYVVGGFGQSTSEEFMLDEARDKCLSAVATNSESAGEKGEHPGVFVSKPGQCIPLPGTDCDAETKGDQTCYAIMRCPDGTGC